MRIGRDPLSDYAVIPGGNDEDLGPYHGTLLPEDAGKLDAHVLQTAQAPRRFGETVLAGSRGLRRYRIDGRHLSYDLR